KTAALHYFTGEFAALQDQKAQLTSDLETRTAATHAQIAAWQDRIRRTAAPPLLSVDPHSFLLGVKVVDEEKRLGLPGLVVRVTNPRHKHCLLAEGMTDLDGNVVLAFTNEQVHDLAREKVEPTIEILAPPDTLLHRTARIACPRLGGAETWVASLHAS